LDEAVLLLFSLEILVLGRPGDFFLFIFLENNPSGAGGDGIFAGADEAYDEANEEYLDDFFFLDDVFFLMDDFLLDKPDKPPEGSSFSSFFLREKNFLIVASVLNQKQ